MRKFWCLISFIIMPFIPSTNLYSQIVDWQDYIMDCVGEEYNLTDTSNRDVIYNSKFGCSLSPHDTIRMLVVFAELVYTDTIPDPSLDWQNHYWDAHSLPRWADSLFATCDTTNFRYKQITRYFQYASSNDHIVLGDYLLAPDNGGVFSVNTTDGEANTTSIVQAVNQKLGTSIVTAHGLSSINEFDMWTIGINGVEKQKVGNGKWDYIVFAVRNSLSPKNPNGSSTSSTLPLLGHGIDKACIVCVGNSSNPTHIIRHEYAHMLLGNNSFHTCGGGWHTNYWIPQTGGWALLGLYGSSLMCWSAWDRYRLGWKGINNAYDISARDSDGITEVNGDIDIHCGNDIYVLRDFVTTGDALRIKLPFIDEGKEYQEWIWLENHQGVNNNNVEFDKWQYQDFECVEDFEPGLMAYVQINSNIRESPDQNSVFSQFADYLNPLTANGFWDRHFPTDSIDNGCVSYSRVRPFTRIQENPLTGCGDQSLYSVDIDGNDIIDKKDQVSNWAEIVGNNTLRHLFQLGHSSHSFTLHGNNKIGIGTNPSSAPLINMVGLDSQNNNVKNLRKTYLNGISVEILEQDATNGNIKVRIRFDDVDVDNDVRWCSDSIILNNIPTSSGYSLNVKQGKTILLDQGLNATRMKNPIDYHGQKIFSSPTTFIVQPDVKIHLDTAASIVLENSSKLYFRERSSCVIEDRGTLIVKRGTVLQLDDCASLVINGTGKLIVEKGAELRISPMAILAFQNGLQNLDMESGVIIYHIFANPNTLIANTISNAVITSSTTWNGLDCKVNGSIVVENGATLSIESSLLRFNDLDGRIVVKQGGRLIIDSSMLKSERNCSDMWQGIEVWGNYFTHQYSTNGSFGQGYLELKNGAVIENAKCAVELWRPDYWSTTGGIIHATDATFRNNATAVHALCYTNHHPATNSEVSYNAFFNNCTFVVDDGYLGNETFHRHVTLADVSGITFSGCDFSADRRVSGVHPWCIGISAYDASFLVDSPCTSNSVPCPDEDLDHSTFTGLCSGIRAGGGRHPRSFTVRNTLFTNNDFGIYAENTDFPTILFNDFRIGGICDFNYGVCLRNVTGFCIEENLFRPYSKLRSTTIGIAVYHSNGVNDIYRNTFQNLSRANLALGQNTTGGTNGTLQGLTYTCNEFSGNQRDIMVLQRDGAGDIQMQQGSASCPSGNTFNNSVFQVYNDGLHQIDYYYNSSDADETPTPSLLYRVNRQGTTNTNACATHYGNNPIVKSPSEKSALESEYLSAYSNYMSVRQLYERRIDGGNTVAQLSDIGSATAADMWQLRAQLLGLSPYVSGQVLTAAADRDDVFTAPVLFEILAANPDELKNDSLIAHLENKSNPLPTYMTDLLRQVASGTSARTALVAQMGKYGHDYTIAAGDIVRSNLNDTVSNPAELRTWLGNMNDIAADRMAISSYLQEGDSTSAFALANMLPTLYGLQGSQLSDHANYLRLLQLYQTLNSTHRNVFQLTEEETVLVSDIADNGNGVSQSMAMAMMEQVSNRETSSCLDPELPDSGRGEKGGNGYTAVATNHAATFDVTLSPNPATTWTTINYTLPDNMTKAVLTLTNALGVNVLTKELEGTQGNKTLDLHNLAPGVYIYTVQCGQLVENGKLVITRQ